MTSSIAHPVEIISSFWIAFGSTNEPGYFFSISARMSMISWRLFSSIPVTSLVRRVEQTPNSQVHSNPIKELTVVICPTTRLWSSLCQEANVEIRSFRSSTRRGDEDLLFPSNDLQQRSKRR